MMTIESTKRLLLRFVQGDPHVSIRNVSVKDFKRLAESMEDETVMLKVGDVVRVLRSYLQGIADIPRLVDWTAVVFYGVHPAMIGHSEVRLGRDTTITRKGVQDPEGISRIHVRYEEKCQNVIADVVGEMEDLGDIRSELTSEDVKGWIQALLACQPESLEEFRTNLGDDDHGSRG